MVWDVCRIGNIVGKQSAHNWAYLAISMPNSWGGIHSFPSFISGRNSNMVSIWATAVHTELSATCKPGQRLKIKYTHFLVSEWKKGTCRLPNPKTTSRGFEGTSPKLVPSMKRSGRNSSERGHSFSISLLKSGQKNYSKINDKYILYARNDTCSGRYQVAVIMIVRHDHVRNRDYKWRGPPKRRNKISIPLAVR